MINRRDLITGAAALVAYSRIGDARAQTAKKLLIFGGPVPDTGFLFLVDDDGSYLLDDDGTYLMDEI